jgi:hypothetical protein
LPLRVGHRIDVEAVLNKLPGHSWHVCWLPREDVAVSPKEVDERVFLFGVEAGPDGGGLAAVACPEADRLDQDLLSWLRLVGFVRLLRDVEFTCGKLLRRGLDLHHSVGYLIRGGDLHSFRVAVV